MKYQILDSLPTYGPMYVPIAENDEPYYSEGFVVRFYKSDGSDWVANFKPGWTSLFEVVELETPKILVVAGGMAYIIDPENQSPTDMFGSDYKYIFKVIDGRVVLVDSTTITVIETNGTYWKSERISWDGIEDLTLHGNIISGVAFNPTHLTEEWTPFKFNIDTRKLIGGTWLD